jgi:hypothetical protein
MMDRRVLALMVRVLARLTNRVTVVGSTTMSEIIATCMECEWEYEADSQDDGAAAIAGHGMRTGHEQGELIIE